MNEKINIPHLYPKLSTIIPEQNGNIQFGIYGIDNNNENPISPVCNFSLKSYFNSPGIFKQ